MFSNFPLWWEGLDSIAKIYWMIAFPSTLFFLIQLIMTFIGGDIDHDMDHDGSIDADHGMGFQFLTFKNMVAFLTLFAWSGLASIEGGFSLAITIIISTISGLIMMTIMAALFYYISGFTHSGTLDYNNAIGETGDVYLTIPAKKSGMGKVQITVQGHLRTLNAMTEDIEDIKTGAIIEVDEIISDSVLLVHRAR
ncbi:MAG: hypothetical protein DRJ10_06260 [Bacteroidetes bacterium]|nr:MAG: hypothetical protein DRJ10_06260 [Bacteroidota bacterium]